MKYVLKGFHAKLRIEFDPKKFKERNFQAWVRSAIEKD